MKLKKILLVGVITMMLSFTACTNTGVEKASGAEAKVEVQKGEMQTDGKKEDVKEETKEVESGYEVETLKLAGGNDWGAPNPYLHASRGPGTAKMRMVFDSLLESDEKGDIPWLAKEWSIEGDTYTFKLEEEATFQDGMPITAEDVAFTLDYYKEFPPITNSLGSGDKFLVSSYEIVDEHTIKMTVNQQLATTLSKLGSFVIIPKHVWEKVEDPYTYNEKDAFIGSGAYQITAYDPASGSYEFTAFENYYGHKQSAERVLFVPVSDNLLAFESGEIDITDVPADLKDKYLSDSEIGIIEKKNDMGYKLLINFEKRPEFLDYDLRKALYVAMDRQGIVDKVFRGSGSVGSAGYCPEGNGFYNEKVEKYPYDKEAATKTFEGKNITLKLLTSNSGSDVKIAELIKADLEVVGIKVEVEAYDSQVRDEKVFANEYELALVGNGGWGRLPDYLRTLYSDTSKNKGSNPHSMGPVGYSNEVITKLAEDQLLELDFNKRKEMLMELQYEISKEIPILVIANQTSLVMYKKDYYSGWMKTYDYQQVEQNRLSYLQK